MWGQEPLYFVDFSNGPALSVLMKTKPELQKTLCLINRFFFKFYYCFTLLCMLFCITFVKPVFLPIQLEH